MRAEALFAGGCVAVSAGLCFSPAMVSVGMGLLGASVPAAAFRRPDWATNLRNPVYVGWMLYFALTAASL
ncbi:MAG: hypothetical protein NZ534_13255, partial [Bacteroidia bacterium]|nr:hypothetical protein [Bacteroidia bacterium]